MLYHFIVMDVGALQLLSRFSLPPDSLGYCGRNTAPEKFKCCVTKGECSDVTKEIEKFIVLYPYLKTLSKISGCEPFSYEVAEAYWIGNDILGRSKTEVYRDLISNFEKQGVPDWLVDELRQKAPKVFIPHHLFHILHVGVGRASGSVPFNMKSINNCMIRWGEVEEVRNNKVVMKLNSLRNGNSGYEIIFQVETLPLVPNFVRSVKLGDTVCVHWGQVVKMLNPEEVGKLDFWTNEVLKGFN